MEVPVLTLPLDQGRGREVTVLVPLTSPARGFCNEG